MLLNNIYDIDIVKKTYIILERDSKTTRRFIQRFGKNT